MLLLLGAREIADSRRVEAWPDVAPNAMATAMAEVPGEPRRVENTRRTSRRSVLLAGLTTLFATSMSRSVEAKTKLKRAEKTKEGVTLFFELDHAPFGGDQGPYRDATVLVFVPAYYRLPKNRKVDAVVHFHGHLSTAYQALSSGRLREQLFDSKQNAVLVAPQGPLRAVDSSGGRLDEKGGLKRIMNELMREMRRHAVGLELEKSSVAGNKGLGFLCLSAHSGGYRVAAQCLRHGGVEVGETYLFDALYGEVATFARWAIAKKDATGRERHKLISHFGPGDAKTNSLDLLNRLEAAGVGCHHEVPPNKLTRQQLSKGQAVFIETGQSHGAVTFSHNNLRDCLFASSLKRFIESDWFEEKKKPRRIDRRG